MNTKIRAELERMAKANGGRLTPEDVVAAAADPASPLHGAFDWDDAAAAAKWRIEQARELIRSVRIEITTETRSLRVVGYVRDPRAAGSETGYVETLAVARKRDRVAVLRTECLAIIGCLQRAIAIAEAVKMVHIAAQLEAAMVEMGQTLEALQ